MGIRKPFLRTSPPYEPVYSIGLFNGKEDILPSYDAMEVLVNSLIALFVIEMVNYEIPCLYDSGVIYEHMPAGRDAKWKDAFAALSTGKANCKTLAAWRIAELRIYYREAARPVIFQTIDPANGDQRWHVWVLRANGKEEDPSVLLGMMLDEDYRVAA